MIDIILAFLSPLWGYIAGGLVLLFGSWLWKRKNAKIERQEQVIQAHEKIEEVHKHDDTVNETTESRIDRIREEVEHAETPEKGAFDIQEAINRYFEGKDK